VPLLGGLDRLDALLRDDVPAGPQRDERSHAIGRAFGDGADEEGGIARVDASCGTLEGIVLGIRLELELK